MLPFSLGTFICRKTTDDALLSVSLQTPLEMGIQMGHQQLWKYPGTKKGHQQSWAMPEMKGAMAGTAIYGSIRAPSWGAFKLVQTPTQSFTDLSNYGAQRWCTLLGRPWGWLTPGLKPVWGLNPSSATYSLYLSLQAALSLGVLVSLSVR